MIAINVKQPDIDPTSRLLFRKFERLADRLPWLPLANLPTPVQRLASLGDHMGLSNLWIKRDDLSSDLYGGNKPRKFEFILAEAKKQGRKTIFAMGGVGSNHAVATTLLSRKVGFDVLLGLAPQPVLSYVRTNILVNHCQGARFVHNANEVMIVLRAMKMYLDFRRTGEVPPYFMYFGGSTPVGNIGFVEAGLELAAQIKKGELPLPRYLFVPTGSCGTHAGLLVGLRLAGIPTEVVGVRVVPKAFTNRFVVTWHANHVARYLRRLDPSFMRMRFNAAEVRLLDGFIGGGYGHPTPEGKEAMRLMQSTEGLHLDPTYSGKTFAALQQFVKDRSLADEPVLFWQTYNSVDLARYCADARPQDLSPEMRRYFTMPRIDPEL